MSKDLTVIATSTDRYLAIISKIGLIRTTASYAATQLIVQLTGLIAGFLIIRSLTKEQYAVYILAATGLGILAVLSDSGISTATMSLIGTARNDKTHVTRYLLAARSLRWKLFTVASLALVPFLIRLAKVEDTGYATASMYCLIVLLAGVLQLNYTLSIILPKVHQDVRSLQRIEVSANGLRLGAVVALSLLMPNVALFLLTSVLSAYLLARLAHQLTNCYLDDSAVSGTAESKDIWRRTLPQIPNSAFYCFFGQASLIVIAVLGGDGQVAEVGALGRLSVLFAVASTTIATVIVPRFSRITEPRLLMARYVQTIVAQVALSVLLLLFAIAFPQLLLLILGDSYAGLEYAVKWSVLAALLHALTGTIWQLNASKGWVQRAWLTIPLIVVAQVCTGFALDLSTVQGAILFGALPMVPALIFLFLVGFRQLSSAVAFGTGRVVSR